MEAKTLKVNMEAINGEIQANQNFDWVFESTDEANGYLVFPPGVTIIKIGETVEVTMFLDKKVKVNRGDNVEEKSGPIGAGQVIDIVD